MIRGSTTESKKHQRSKTGKPTRLCYLLCAILLLLSAVASYFVGYSNGTLGNPTSSELQAFLEADKTSERTYSEEYSCAQFARDLKKNANSVGIKCGFVLLDFKEVSWGHTVVVFKTTDNGLVYIDSTDGPDFETYPKVGERMELEERNVTVARIVTVW